MELRYDITVTGEQNIRRALRGVESEIAASSKRAAAAATRLPGGATARRSTERESIAAQRRVAKEAESAIKKSEREQIASAKRVERERIASERAVAREQQRHESYWAKARAASRERDRREQEATARMRAATAQSFGRGVGSTVGRSVSGTVRTIAGIGGTILGVAGIAGAGEAVSQEIGLDQRLRQVSANARQAGTEGVDPRMLRGGVRNAALATGASESGLVGALETYTARTGDIKSATDNLRTFATVAMATGASVEDVASTAADLAQKFNITKPKEMADAFAVLAFQGKRGAFELRDMANTFPEMAAAAQRAGMTGVGGMKTLGGLAQLARTSTGSGAEASTAVQMMMTQLIAKAGDLKSGKALGGRAVNVFEGGDATKPVRDIRQVLAETISKSHGNLTQLGELFDVRGVRAASPLISAYRSASDAAGGGSKGEAAGKAAVLKAISDAADAAAYFSEVEKDAADVAKSDAVKLEKINIRLREAFSTKLLPVLERMMPEFEKMIPQIAAITESAAHLAEWFLDNPFKGLGAVVLGKVAIDLAGAGIGAAVRSMLTSLISGVAGSGAGAAAGGALSGAAGALVGGAGRGVGALAGGATAALGAGGALAAAGGLAAASLAWAGYEGKQLYDSTAGFTDWGTEIAKPVPVAEYRAKYGYGDKPAGGAGQGGAATMAAAEATSKAAAEMSAAAKEMSAAARLTVPARTTPIVNRN